MKLRILQSTRADFLDMSADQQNEWVLRQVERIMGERTAPKKGKEDTGTYHIRVFVTVIDYSYNRLADLEAEADYSRKEGARIVLPLIGVLTTDKKARE